jgi:hypothetical protein
MLTLADLNMQVRVNLQHRDLEASISGAWKYEWDLGSFTGAKLEAFRQAAQRYRQSRYKWAEAGHEAAAALARFHVATIGDIAVILNVDYADAALLLTYRPPPEARFRYARPVDFWSSETRVWAAYEAALRARQLALMAAARWRGDRANKIIMKRWPDSVY